MGWTDKEDLANLFIQIAINPYIATSDRYIAVNGMGSTNEIFAAMAEVSGVKPPSIPLPKKLIEPMGIALLTVFSKKAPVSPESFSFGLHGHERQFSSDAAREDYNWQTKTLAQTLSEIKVGYKPKP